MPVYALGEQIPDIHPEAFVHPDAVIIGSVTLGAEASVWPSAVLRADYGVISIGARTSIQDGTVVHTTELWPTVIGADCVVGHNVHLEGCEVGDWCLIGSGSIVLAPGAAVGAGALVAEGVVVDTGQIAVGLPARMRPVPGDLNAWVRTAVETYVAGGRRYRAQLRRIS
jgi:carbonic anhydrase/acetyltransferase-like protein (isoleucine patch superfamily)